MITPSVILSLFFIPIFYLFLTNKMRIQLGRYDTVVGISFGIFSFGMLYLANIDMIIKSFAPSISNYSFLLMFISLVLLVIKLFKNDNVRGDNKKIVKLLITMGLLVAIFATVATPVSFLVFPLYFILVYNVKEIGFYSKSILGCDLALLVLIEFYTGALNGYQWFILSFFIVRVLLFVPLILRNRIQLNILVAQFPIVLLLIDAVTKKFSIEGYSSSFFLSGISLSLLLIFGALFSKQLLIRTRLLALAFLPILLAWGIDPFSFLSLFLLIIITLFFSFIHLSGKVIFSTDNKWVQLVPIYFFAYIVSPLPGSPFFFALIDQLKVSTYSIPVYITLSLWLVLYTFLLLSIIEGKIVEDSDSDVSIHPVKVVLFVCAVVLMTLCFVERFYLYEILNSVNFTLSFFNFSNHIKEVGFRFYIVGLPFLSMFSILVFYSLRRNEHFLAVKTHLKMRYFYYFDNVFDKHRYLELGSISSRAGYTLFTAPFFLIKSASRVLSISFLTIYNFLFKVSKDISHLNIGTHFILILVVLLIALLLTYGGNQ